ncbi:hypothetical protein ACHAPT_013401 [Fusarium lateritium]
MSTASNTSSAKSLPEISESEAPSSIQVWNRPHPRATDEGLFAYGGFRDDVEPLENYHVDGYHPVELGDCLGASGQYHVLHRLGHGGFSTVWLCRDTQHGRYVAVKIMMAEVESDEVQEPALSQLDQDMPGAEFIVTLLDHFVLAGPNGTHQCLVLPLLGPRVSPGLWRRMKQDPEVMLPRLARQATQALSFLHKHQVCHGDFRPANILLKLAKIDHLSTDDLYDLIDAPDTVPIHHVSGSLPACSPKYLVRQANLSGLDAYFSDQIAVIDFGEAYPFSSPLEAIGIPFHYLPPELLLDEPVAPSPAADLWALGCTLFEIRQQLPLFYASTKPDEKLAQIVCFFGKLPDELWNKWEARKYFFDDQGRWIGFSGPESFENRLKRARKIFPGESAPRSSMTTPDAEQKLMTDLLYKLLRYEPSERLSAEKVLEHEWLQDK